MALFTIPFLIKGLGEEKFGILSLAWVVIGYFSLFDFGIGRTLTKIVAEKIGLEEIDEIPGLFWTAYSYVYNKFNRKYNSFNWFTIYSSKYFNISKDYQIKYLYFLCSCSFDTNSDNYRRFKRCTGSISKIWTDNLFRSFLGVFTFVGPLFC